MHLLPDRTMSRPQNPPCHSMMSRGQTTNFLFVQTKISQNFPLLTFIRVTKAAHDWSPRNTECPCVLQLSRNIPADNGFLCDTAIVCSGTFCYRLPICACYTLRPTLTWFPWPPSCSGCSIRGSDSSSSHTA